MSLRTALAVFAALFAVTSAALWGSAKFIVARSVPPQALMSGIRAALDRGETDLAGRLLVKAVFYSGNPDPFIRLASTQPGLADYLAAIDAVRRRPADAESALNRARSRGSPLIEARAKIRLEEMRYGAALPNADRLPF